MKERLRLGGLFVAAGKYKFDRDSMHRSGERNGKGGRVIAGDRGDAGHFTARRKGRCRRVAYIKVSKERVPVIHDNRCENGHRAKDRERENDKEYECYWSHKISIELNLVLSIAGKNKTYRLFDRGVLIPCRDRSGFQIQASPV